MKLDMVAPAAGPSVVMYAIGCFRRAALDITQCGDSSETKLAGSLDMASKTTVDSARSSAQQELEGYLLHLCFSLERTVAHFPSAVACRFASRNQDKFTTQEKTAE